MEIGTGLFSAIDDLRINATDVIEESFRLTIKGAALDMPIAQKIQSIYSQLQENKAICSILVNNEPLDVNELSDELNHGDQWQIVIGKGPLSELMKLRETENTLLFFSLGGFNHWLSSLDPFLFSERPDPDLTHPTTIWVHGLNEAFGGPSLWILPVGYDSLPPNYSPVSLPASSCVNDLVHVSSPLRIHPESFALTWGNLNSTEANPLILLSASVLAASLSQEFKKSETTYEVILRGMKRISLPLVADNQVITPEILSNLIETIHWVYEERPNTRLQLVIERLSIDIEPGQSFLDAIQRYLDGALQQAKDSYSFVILERKDAYLKEMREMMKDMRIQADLYASKVRDLVGYLTRDVLGVMVFFGFSFIGKFDQKNLHSLIDSSELALLSRFLSGYLILSIVAQCITQWRDANMTFNESKTWLSVLQNYTSQADKQERFLDPIEKRRKMFFSTLRIVCFIYFILFVVTWNLPIILKVLLRY